VSPHAAAQTAKSRHNHLIYMDNLRFESTAMDRDGACDVRRPAGG
jgi:hypothetical protein